MENEFANQARKFIHSVIHTRQTLIRDKKSKLSHGLAEKTSSDLLHLLGTKAYRTNQLMAGFWHRKGALILQLLPGSDNSSHKELMNKYHLLDLESKLYWP